MQLIYSTLVVLLVFSNGFNNGNAELELLYSSDDANMVVLMGKAAGGIFRRIYESDAIPQEGKTEARAKDPMDTLATLPLPLPDPLMIGNLSLGSFALGDAALYGLSNAQVDVAINSTELIISLLVEVPSLSSDGFYEADFALEYYGTPINAKGAGAHNISIQNFTIGLDLTVNIDLVSGNLTGVSNVSVSIEFDYRNMNTLLENFALNDVLTDWTDSNTQGLFAQIVYGQIKAANATIDGAVENLLNTVLQACPLAEIIGGDLSCLGLTQPEVTTGPTSTDGSTIPETTGGVVGSATMSLITTILCLFVIYLS